MPGPGSYRIPSGFQSVQRRSTTTFGHRPALYRQATDSPGPGSYRGNEQGNRVKGSAWGSFSSKRFKDFGNGRRRSPLWP